MQNVPTLAPARFAMNCQAIQISKFKNRRAGEIFVENISDTLKPHLHCTKRTICLANRVQVSGRYVTRAPKKLMKKIMRPIITIGLGVVLALFSAALTYSAPPAMQGNLSTAALFLQPTKTPPPKGVSEIGSTDGII